MRRFFRAGCMALAALLLSCGALAGCTSGAPNAAMDPLQDPAMSGTPQQNGGAEIALVTSNPRLESAFGQAVWSAVTLFSGENGVSCVPYKAEEDDAEAALLTLELAVRGGARLVIAMDESVSLAVSQAAAGYPEVDFLLLDLAPEQAPAANCAIARFPAAQAGWLAGYLAAGEAAGLPVAVVQGESAASQQYALGFLMGLQQAAEDRGLEPGRQVVYPLLFTADTTEAERSELLKAACAEGAAVLFAADPATQQETLAAARTAGSRVMGIGLQLDTTPHALASVEQHPAGLVTRVLGLWLKDRFPGGQSVGGSLMGGDIALKAELARFDHVGERRYAAAVDKLKNGLIPATLNARLKPDREGAMPAPEDLALDRLLLKQPGEDAPAGEGTPANGGAAESPASGPAASSGPVAAVSGEAA